MPTTSATTNRDMPEDWLSRLRHPPPHPGQIFKDLFRVPLDISQADAARRLGVSNYYWNQVELGRRPVSMDTAVKLSALTHVSAEFWAKLQLHYDLWHAIQDAKKRRKVIPGAAFPKPKDHPAILAPSA
jgi:addiction module HigA family antidote